MVVTGNPVKSHRCGQHKRENAYNMPHKCHSTITANANVVDSLLWSRASVKYIYYSISNHKDKKAQIEESIEILKKKLDTALEEKKKIKLKQERNENSYINMLISDDSYTKNKDKIAQELSRIAQDCVKYNSSIVNQEQQLKVLESYSEIPIESLVKLVNTTFENRDMAKMQEIVRMFIKELNVYYSEEDNKHKIYKITFQDGTVEYWRQDYYRTGMEYVERKISNDGLVVYIPAYNSSIHIS